MTPEAKNILAILSAEHWKGTRQICEEGGFVYRDHSANHSLVYRPLRELMSLGMVEKRAGGIEGHPHYTEYRKK